MFPNINTHSYYSLLDSTLSIDDIINLAIQNKQKYVFLTDNNFYGSIEFIISAKKQKLIPIIGLDIEYQNSPMVLFPKSYTGFTNLNKISSLYLSGNDFDINQYLKDVIIIFKKEKNNSINIDDFFCIHDEINSIAINEVRYKNIDDSINYLVMNAIKNNLKLDSMLIKSDENMWLSQEQYEQKFSFLAIENTKNLVNKLYSYTEFVFSELVNFKNIDKGYTSKSYLKKLCFDYLYEKIDNQDLEKYKNRLEYELSTIDKMNFNNYFLIVYDFVCYAKNNGILIGPGRGSAAGSLVSYLLGITQIDPIKYNLIFERFLNPNRNSMPDIDIDVMDKKREQIYLYLFDKYGYDHVAHIITFQRIKLKTAIRDVGRVIGIDLQEINKICKLIPNEYEDNFEMALNYSNQLQEFYKTYKVLFEFAKNLINAPRQVGLHAAGIVLSSKPLYEIIPTQINSQGLTTTQISMEYLELFGLLKIDILGLNNLSIINDVIMLIKKTRNIDLNLNSIPIDDNKVFKEISLGNTMGIFQLESPGMRKTLQKIKPKNLEDISLVSALYRPGPQKNIDDFVKFRNNPQKINYVDEKLKLILKDTNGIIVYQEQVIEIVKKVANYSSAEADIFRKVISKKDEKNMLEQKEKFLDSAIKNGYSQKHAYDIFCYIEKFAEYGFNHSHSISYALISYWMMYLKIYFSIEFFSLLLSSTKKNFEKVKMYFDDAKQMNIDIMPPSINISNRNFRIFKNKIYFGLTSIANIGPEKAKKIIEIRNNMKDKKFNSYQECIYQLSINKINDQTLKILIQSGAFDEFGYSRQGMMNNLDKIIKESSYMIFGDELANSIDFENLGSINDNNDLDFKNQEKLLGIKFE